MKHKSPFLGGLLNVVVPGLSSVYIGRWGRAVLQLLGALILLVVLLFLAGLIESTDPPWPNIVTGAAMVALWFLLMFLGGVRTVRRYNRALPAEATTTGPDGNRAVVAILAIMVVVLCLLLVAVSWLSGRAYLERRAAAITTGLPEVITTNLPEAISTNLPDAITTILPQTIVTGLPESISTELPLAAATALPKPATPELEAAAGAGLATAMPEPTALPSATVPPTGTPTATPEPRAVVIRDRLNVRSGPGLKYARVALLRRGDAIVVTGRNKPGTWLAVRLPDGTLGWVSADLVRLEPRDASIPIAGRASATPAPAEPTATLTVDEQIAGVAAGEHGTLPQPGEMGSVEAGGQAEVTILNDTPYELTILVGAPNSQMITIDACATCEVYSMVGPVLCQEEGRPIKKVRLQPGSGEVVARAADPAVLPFYGQWELKGDTAYLSCFYIVRK